MADHDQPPRMRLVYRVLWWMTILIFRVYFRSRVFGADRVPRTGPVLLVSNHQSYLDPMAANFPIPREASYMARDSLFRNRLFRGLITMLNAFPVKRGAADVSAVKEAVRRLRKNYALTVFPEATRTSDGSIGRINPNSMAIAKMARATIVPTIIDGAFEAWPRSSRFPRPRRIDVSYAEPIPPSEVERYSTEELAAIVSQRLLEGLEQSRKRRNRKN